MSQHRIRASLLSLAILYVVNTISVCFGADVSYPDDIAPILTKHCAGCHNDTDLEGDFSVSAFDAIMQGEADEEVAVPGDPEASHFFQLMTGKAEPAMPPEGESELSDAEIELVRSWIEQGMKPGATMQLASRLAAPQLEPAPAKLHYVGAACASASYIALGTLGRVDCNDLTTGDRLWSADGFAGKVNSLRTSKDGKTLVVGSGIAGLGGEIALLDSTSGEVLKRFEGHDDTVYCAALSPDGTLIASGSYDRRVIIWDVQSQKIVRELTGHNGAIYDLDFDPSGKILATASADQTVKLWNVNSGERLDTLGQPEGEMRCVRFSSQGDAFFAGGSDKQIRKWKVITVDQPGINPMLVARYAHESDVLQLELAGKDHILSTSSDLTAKLWSTTELEPLGELTTLSDTPVGLSAPKSGKVAAVVVELTGAKHEIKRGQLRRLAKQAAKRSSLSGEGDPASQPTSDAALSPESEMLAEAVAEAEPNDQLSQAQTVKLPTIIEGTISPEQKTLVAEDRDLFRFAAKAGETWLIEVDAASDGSTLDSRIDILDENGEPVVRTRMQAVRESYFTFRGKDSDTSDDFRMHKWEDMELDEYLYSSGEIVKLWLYPRGPDSGFKTYPGTGKRYTFFGTTAVAHALGEPAYIVRELARGETPLPNGLPVFPIYFENDDDGQRRAGKDSRLEFAAPETGEYTLRIRDARGFGGEDFKYKIKIRKPEPDFAIKVSNPKLTMPLGSGREWSVTATRTDGLAEPISIFIEDLPEGFVATNPLIIEAGQNAAFGVIYATDSAQLPADRVIVEQDASEKEAAKDKSSNEDSAEAKESQAKKSDSKEKDGDKTEKEPPLPYVELKLVASCEVGGREIVHELDTKLQLSISSASPADSNEVQLRLYDDGDGGDNELTELTIGPGQTISAKIVVDRNGEKARISLGSEDSGRNLPHGAFVDNIGLNGLLITEDRSEREFFITAAPKVKPGRRQFHLRSETKGNPTSRPIWLNVLPRE